MRIHQLPEEQAQRFCYLDLENLTKLKSLKLEIKRFVSKDGTKNNGRIILDEMPLRFPGKKWSLQLNYLGVFCEMFDIEVQNILPANGKFYQSDQPWNVQHFELKVNKLCIPVSNLDQNHLKFEYQLKLNTALISKITIPSVDYVSLDEKRDFILQNFKTKKETQEDYLKLVFQELSAPFNQIVVYARHIQVNINIE